MAAKRSMILAIFAGLVFVATSAIAAPPSPPTPTPAPPMNSAATPRVNISVPRVNIVGTRANISVPRANITGSRDVGHTTIRVRAAPTPDVTIGAAVGSSHGHHHYNRHRYNHHHHARYETTTHRSLSSPPTTVQETYMWVSVPVYGRTGGVTHHAYYWHPAVVPPFAETARRVDPALFGAPPPAAPPAAQGEADAGGSFRIEDKAREAMRSKNYKHAARLYQQRWMAIVDSELGIDEGTTAAADRDLVLGALGQSHAEVLRLRAIALVGAGRHEHAVRELQRAYRLEPTLAMRPVLGKDLVGDPYRLRRLVNSSVRYAHRADDAEAWVLVAMLMQAEGRDRVARKMLARVAPTTPPTLPSSVDDAGQGERPLSIFRD